jgi:RNA polymerase sigma factor (sigma-70 family)
LPDSTTAPVSAPTNPLPSTAPVQPSSDAGSSAEYIADQAEPPVEVAQREGGSARIGTAANPLAANAPARQSSGVGSNAEDIAGQAAPPGEFARREGDNARTGSGTSTLTASDAGLRNIAPSDGNSPSGGRGAPAGPTDSVADSRPLSNGMVPPASDQARATEVRTAQVDTSVLPCDLSDSSLLQRFVVNRDQTAFTAIVERHERLVFGVCKRVLGDSHAAEDAFQATFLVLARKASMLDWHRPLSAWLYTVAMRLAWRLRAVASRQRRSENVVALRRPTHEESANEAAIETKEVHQVLREELQRLPERYRSPLVLCYFYGRTHAEAARAIGLPRGSIAKRIGEALAQLRQRLIDRGVTL